MVTFRGKRGPGAAKRIAGHQQPLPIAISVLPRSPRLLSAALAAVNVLLIETLYKVRTPHVHERCRWQTICRLPVKRLAAIFSFPS